ncbi:MULTISPECIES: hypothetical protein [unclassified Bradyrhizobium]|uniref:hypothetical protein n=1 Tax=unclassified Bradyrhizobium TaxID=2631580 RepID=UPI002916D5FB|nr:MULTISPECIES: hypothetical protein [unclassified Bradyrhizobium]
MKKATTKKSTAEKAKKAVKKATPAAAAKGKVSGGKITKQPQVKQQAAVAHAMFLYTDDAWSLRYFDQNDLHFLEREVFG